MKINARSGEQIPPAAGTAGWFRHAGDRFAAALGKEDRELALGVFSAADRARDGRVGLAHRADGFEDFFTILADIFVNWHILLTKINSLKIVHHKQITKSIACNYDQHHFTLFPVEIGGDFSPGSGIPFQDRIGHLCSRQPVFGGIDQVKQGCIRSDRRSSFGVAAFLLSPRQWPCPNPSRPAVRSVAS